MSLDKLLIIFLIIILPIALVLNTYVNTQADTINTQSLYDTKLLSATSDTLKAYQSNTFNESGSEFSVVQSNNIEASSNVFLNSIANNFGMEGFSKETLQSHVPAIVYTLYDGFYIFSKFQNTLDTQYQAEKPTYKNGEYIYGVKPYIFYSCRYKIDAENDFIITYSLDNYISIRGFIKGKWINDAGYLIDNIEYNESTGVLKYRGVTIPHGEEFLKEYYADEKSNEIKVYNCIKRNGVKYYQKDDGTWFSTFNDQVLKATDITDADYSAYNYYKEAYEFTQRVRKNRNENDYNLENLLKVGNAIEYSEMTNVSRDEDKSYITYDENNSFITNDRNAKIFQSGSYTNDTKPSIEDPDSNFNQHRRSVIRYVIEKNLSIAISNYNKYAENISTNFLMPVLKETDWEKILNNISVISFMQGLPIGSKTYNGYAVVSNNKNNEIVSEDSIAIVNMPNRNSFNQLRGAASYYYYDIKKKGISSEVANPVGVFIGDLQKRQYYNSLTGTTMYYYPKLYYADYSSIVTRAENVNISAEETDNNYKYAYNGNIYKYIDKVFANNDVNSKEYKMRQAYYTALGRERYGLYKVDRQIINDMN
ncbi:MAG: hypothetical protein IKF38_07285 [Clostridia bacterium]|nr:hypothetical protein [Clostridia bacterium]